MELYTWITIKGEKGDQGIQGEIGVSIERIFIDHDCFVFELSNGESKQIPIPEYNQKDVTTVILDANGGIIQSDEFQNIGQSKYEINNVEIGKALKNLPLPIRVNTDLESYKFLGWVSTTNDEVGPLDGPFYRTSVVIEHLTLRAEWEVTKKISSSMFNGFWSNGTTNCLIFNGILFDYSDNSYLLIQKQEDDSFMLKENVIELNADSDEFTLNGLVYSKIDISTFNATNSYDGLYFLQKYTFKGDTKTLKGDETLTSVSNGFILYNYEYLVTVLSNSNNNCIFKIQNINNSSESYIYRPGYFENGQLKIFVDYNESIEKQENLDDIITKTTTYIETKKIDTSTEELVKTKSGIYFDDMTIYYIDTDGNVKIYADGTANGFFKMLNYEDSTLYYIEVNGIIIKVDISGNNIVVGGFDTLVKTDLALTDICFADSFITGQYVNPDTQEIYNIKSVGIIQYRLISDNIYTNYILLNTSEENEYSFNGKGIKFVEGNLVVIDNGTEYIYSKM